MGMARPFGTHSGLRGRKNGPAAGERACAARPRVRAGEIQKERIEAFQALEHTITYEDAVSRCWLEVDLDAIRDNYRTALALVGGKTTLIPVLKADAYGMGAAEVGRLLHREGARLFAVATGDEAEQLLRQLPGEAKVLTLGLVGKNQLSRLIAAGMPLTLFSEGQGRAIAEAAAALGRQAEVHVKVDTGLHRLGLDPETAAETVAQIHSTGRVRIAGLFTHLGIHTAEMDHEQTMKLRRVRDQLREKGIEIPLTHAVDSIGMARYPEDHLDAARVGAWLYGVTPYHYGKPELCKGVARFKARVSQVRTVKKGEMVGYDDDHPLPEDRVIATISAGYVDGFPRLAHGQAIEIRGGRALVCGLVCMDQLMADVTDIPGVTEGDEVVFVGGIIGLNEYARMGQLNRNEAWARIGKRVPRVYFGGGAPVRVRSEGWA
jgi:alanine racemase